MTTEEEQNDQRQHRRDAHLARQNDPRETKKAPRQKGAPTTSSGSSKTASPTPPSPTIPDYAIKVSLRASLEHIPIPAYTRNKVLINVTTPPPPAVPDQDQGQEGGQ